MDTSQYLASPSAMSATTSSASETLQRKITPAKRDKMILQEFDQQIKEIRSQLGEQLKSFGERTETQVAVLSEFEEYFRRRGEAESEHAKQLDKLAKNIMHRHKMEKSRRDSWAQHVTCSTWQQLVDDTREEAAQRVRLAELYSKQITSSIAQRCDDLARISKKCREIGALSHGEISRVLNELHTAMKTYQLCFSETTIVEKKLRFAEEEVQRYEDANKGKTPGRKHKTLLKYLRKRLEKYDNIRLKCTKARNEYLLCVRAANAALHRFFAQDLSYLVDCMDLGMEFWMHNLLDQVIDARKQITQKEMESLGELGTLKSSLDTKVDKQRFFEANNSTFMLPKQFEFRPQLGDNVHSVSAESSLAVELAQRQKQIERRLEALRFESDEVWKSLEACERQLVNLYKEEVVDVQKWRADLLVTYQYYLKKFEYFLLNGNLVERLEARSKSIAEALNSPGEAKNSDENGSRLDRPKRMRRIGQHPDKPRPRLFGGSLEEYAEATQEAIPLVVVSSIAFLSRYALRHQGLFRVSGSQSEINRFKEAFERGEDPLLEFGDGSEANSVAGVLKLYFRELREPLFPIYLFDQFTDCAKADSDADFVTKTRSLLSSLPVSTLLLLRVLFAFLAHLCEFADENMMEPHNLAICLGPALMPIPEGKDQVFYHNFVNELVRGLIIHHSAIFPSPLDLPGPAYDKYAVATHHMDFADDVDGLVSGDEEEGRASEEALDFLTMDRDVPLTTASQAHPGTPVTSTSSLDHEETIFRDLAFRDVFRELAKTLKNGDDIEERSCVPIEGSMPPSSRSSTRSTFDASRLLADVSPACSQNSAAVSPACPLLSRPPTVSLREQLSHLSLKESSTHKVYPFDLTPVGRMVPNQQKTASHLEANLGQCSLDTVGTNASAARGYCGSELLTDKQCGNDIKTRLSMTSPLASEVHDELRSILRSSGLQHRLNPPDLVREHCPVQNLSVQEDDVRRGQSSPPFAELERAIEAVQKAGLNQ